MKQITTKKKVIRIILFFVIAFFILIAVKIIVEIAIDETLKTKYHKTKNQKEHVIETACFKIKTPKSWIHIFSGYGDEGDPYGYFWTENGRINYEYGRFGPSYNEDDEIYEYYVDKRRIGRFDVNIAVNKNGETGIGILPQHEMNRTMSFYMDKSITSNLDELIEGIKEIEFKKK